MRAPHRWHWRHAPSSGCCSPPTLPPRATMPSGRSLNSRASARFASTSCMWWSRRPDPGDLAAAARHLGRPAAWNGGPLPRRRGRSRRRHHQVLQAGRLRRDRWPRHPRVTRRGCRGVNPCAPRSCGAVPCRSGPPAPAPPESLHRREVRHVGCYLSLETGRDTHLRLGRRSSRSAWARACTCCTSYRRLTTARSPMHSRRIGHWARMRPRPGCWHVSRVASMRGRQSWSAHGVRNSAA